MKNYNERLEQVSKGESVYRIMEEDFTYQGNTEGYYKSGTMLLTSCDEFLGYVLIAKIKKENVCQSDVLEVKKLKSELVSKGHKDIFNA